MRSTARQTAETFQLRRKIRILLLLLFLGLFAGGGVYYWWLQDKYPTTYNAYIGGNIVRVAPLISGKVTDLYIKNDQFVRVGQPLFSLDNEPLELSVAEARSAFDSAANTVGSNASDAEKVANEVDDAFQKYSEAVNKYAVAVYRHNSLVAVQDKPTNVVKELNDSLKVVKDSKRTVETSLENLEKARKDITRTGTSYYRLRTSIAKLHQAHLQRLNADIIADKTGWATALEIRPGSVLQAGKPVFAIVEDGDRWIDANFKETAFHRLRVGQPVEITVDMYPDLEIKGTVESFSGGSGAVFSALPPENATGNWVKVTQRFTVRISVDNFPYGRDRPLRIGSSAYVTVDTTGVDEE